MARPVTLFTGKWADLPIDVLAPLAREMGYDGPLSLEREGAGVNRVHGARESAAFDAAFGREQ